MNVIEKLKRSWWIIFSFIMTINGFGFLYIGFRNNNKNWVIEGIIYEIPWVFSLIYINNRVILDKLVVIGIIVMFISIIRSIWVAVKLSDVYDNEDKYTIRPTVINNENNSQENDNLPNKVGCCACIFFIFIIFAIIAIL